MKAALLLVLGVLSAAALSYVFMTAGPPRIPAAAETSVARAATTEPRPTVAAAEASVTEPLPLPVAAPPEAPIARGRRSLDGTLEDRFGSPIAGERVFLVDEHGAHPPANAQLTDYVTALTSPAGGFSLTLSDDGPWRLAVGPPGEPRVPISEPRLLTETTSAEVVLPGSAMLRVAFDTLPEGGEPIRLEVLSLREPRADGERRGGGRNRAERGDRGDERTRNRRRQRDRGTEGGTGRRGRGGTVEGTSQDGGDRQSALDVRAAPPVSIVYAPVASIAQQDEQNARAERRRGQRGQGQRGRARGAEEGATPGEPSSDEGAVQGPPPERWRALRRHELTPEEREARVVEFERFPAGPVCRLALFQGDLSLEGAARFTLQEDAVLEVRVLPIVNGSSSSLSYTTSLQFLAAEDRPVGVRWRD